MEWTLPATDLAVPVRRSLQRPLVDLHFGGHAARYGSEERSTVEGRNDVSHEPRNEVIFITVVVKVRDRVKTCTTSAMHGNRKLQVDRRVVRRSMTWCCRCLVRGAALRNVILACDKVRHGDSSFVVGGGQGLTTRTGVLGA